MSHRRSDDLNLSLTGSQISAISARSTPSRPKSGQSKPANSGSLSKTSNKTSSEQTKPASNRKDSAKDRIPPHSNRSGASSVTASSVRKKLVNGSNGHVGKKEDDFLSFFESSVQSKVKRPSSVNSNGHSKKPSSNAVKVLWSGPKLPSKKPAWAYRQDPQTDSARSEEPYNIFYPKSARSSDDEMEPQEVIEELDSSLSQSINKLHSMQLQLSGVNKNSNPVEREMTLDSVRTNSTSNTKTPTPQRSPRAASVDDFIQDVMNQTSMNNNNAVSSTKTSSNSGLPQGGVDDGGETVPSLANNVSCPGQKQKAKMSLSSIENSYQNIRHKTPVNQVKTSQHNTNVAGTRASPVVSRPSNLSKASKKSTGQSLVDNYISTLNDAAVKIQKWFRRHRVRRTVGEAAMRRLLSQRKQDIESNMQADLARPAFSQEEKMEERKKIREEKAREARQQAIKELQKKREEHKNEVKKIADEEISFLQSSGKITKSPSNSSLSGRKKKPLPKANRSPVASPRQEVSISASGGEDPGDYFRSTIANGEQASLPQSKSVVDTDVVTQSQGRTTLEDLYSTLKILEEEENFLSARSAKKPSWLDDLEKGADGEPEGNLTAENLQRLNSSKDGVLKSGFLSDDKLKSIINFLDEVQVTDRLSEIDTEISRMNEEMEKPALLVPSGEEVAQLEQAQATASEVTTTMLSQRLELDEKKRTVSMLQKALNQQRELTVRHAKETEKEMKKRLDVQKEEYEETIKRHLSFIDQLIDDKKNLGEKCEKLVMELKTVDKKFQDKLKSMDESHTLETTKLKEVHSAAEKLRRERWIEDKTKKIKEMTVKGLEPEIQRLIAKHKSDVKKIKQIHEAELLEADERAAQKYVKMTEDLRDQLASEKEAACARERELSKQRYEKQLQQEEEAYQQQRRRLHQEVQEEKDRLASSSSRQKSELEKLQRQLEDAHRHALESMREEFDKSRQEQELRHKTEVKSLHEKLKLEKESWEENYMKRHETWLVQKERELRDQVKKERDKEIELVIERLEEEASKTREDSERGTEQKTRRMREKYDVETRELEQSERKAVQKYNEIKARMTEVEGENERLKVIIRQKEQEILDGKKLIEKMNSERSHVSDIIRQEFADRIVATDEENKRIKHEISELKARQRLQIEKMERQMEELRVTKDEEMEEVHKRVKQAILKKEDVVSQLKQQYQAANKRADHLEGLLEQQRKQLLKK